MEKHGLSNGQLEDNQIIELFWNRSEQGIAAILDKYGSLCENIAMNVVGNREDAIECVNDAYLAVWNSIPPNRPDSLVAYVLKIVRNVSINRVKYNNAMKRRGNYQECFDELEEFVSGSSSPEDAFIEEELKKYIDEFIGKMSKGDRYLFVRRYYYMDSYSELVEKSGMKEGAIRTRLTRIREKLKRFLEKKGVSL